MRQHAANTQHFQTTFLERLEHSLSSEDKCKIKINHEPVDEFQRFWGNDMINPLLNFYKNQKENASVFQNCFRHPPMQDGSSVSCATTL